MVSGVAGALASAPSKRGNEAGRHSPGTLVALPRHRISWVALQAQLILIYCVWCLPHTIRYYYPWL